ncbi:NineTeen Complex (NTC) component [Perkinsus olseni]|uniref:NineTeen Complex (NTC) component n=3 Tax=Perkinsus olseni TaxID=32597 RepID=A0A7J6TCD9_PEROL|nr:NineTeen Complex (NTC) component [Perkinsus olseni]KAF4680087.1 NineTeen Complex (NTC) component [Perkinsus olseni]KAF4742954.1 NineTeen Complex (NTC) component [Perkinsus olseni]
MARSEEKAMHLLNRWVDQQRKIETGQLFQRPHYNRPRYATDCTSLKDCVHWRQTLVRDISKNISDIQNASLGEQKIRELNDLINRLLRTKKHWEDQIRALGGPDYSAMRAGAGEAGEGAEIIGGNGYKYFGAAKDLPGVRELFEHQRAMRAAEDAERKKRRTRKELYQDIEPDYFGWRADDDEVQLLEESQRELELQLEAEEEYRRTHGISPHKRGRTASSGSASSATAAVAQPTPSSPSRRQATAAAYKSFVSVPTEGEIDKLILAKKKQLLVQQYVSDKDKEQQKETEDMLSTSKGGA